VIGELRRAGTMVMQTVTSPDEARLAAAAGVDMLAVQGVQAGGHYGSFTPSRRSEQLPLTELVRAVRAAVPVPLVAAGGLASPEEVAAVLGVGAEAVVVGTVLLRTEECGASAPYRTALAGGTGDTIVTRAFSGRPARALPNLFTERYDALAPSGYPAIHHLTSPLRRAAAAAGDADRINIWAGTGYRAASEGSAVDVLHRLAERV
jgi:nitronate monooxygenase